ncbi:MAG: glycosyltransferase [Sulfuricurvum sp.]|uniref:CgeB family protein n=1 Tax=Sulfuricurvum sp. TaxID=2025608 RepID=UPI0035634A5A
MMLKAIKQKIQKWRLDFENRTYEKKYIKKFGSIPPFETFLLKENNFSGRKLGIIYLTSYDGTFSINNTYLPLQELGNVFRFEMDPQDDRKGWYAKKERVNEEMIAYVKDVMENNSIDIIVCYQSGRTLTQTTLDFFDTLTIPIINEGLDDERKFRSRKGPDGMYRGMKDVCRYFDLSLTTSKSALIKYEVEGGKARYKPYAANPEVYKKLGLEKKYDVAFVGAYYGTRPYYINYLQANGINIMVKGQGWREGEASPDEMIEIFNQAKIVLGFAGVGISDEIFILKGRDFEVPLTGSFYMTQRHHELNEYFTLGYDIETYETKEELLQKVQYYLSHEVEREKIAEQGYQKSLTHYTAKAAYEKIFSYLGL